MDNTQDLQDNSPQPPEGMVKMGQGDTTQEKVPDTTQEETPQTADVEAEQTQAPEVKTEDKAGEADEKMILGKFKSQEDLEKAYTELESHNKKVEMDKAEVDKFIQDAYPESKKKEPTPEIPKAEEAAQTEDEAFQRAADKLAPLLKERIIDPILTKPLARFEIREMLDKYGENFKANLPKIQAARKENPSLLKLPLEDVYRMVAFDDVARTSEIKGIKQAAQTAEEKVKAQVESSQPSGLKTSTIEDALKDPKVSVSEIAEAIPELEPFAKISRERAKM